MILWALVYTASSVALLFLALDGWRGSFDWWAVLCGCACATFARIATMYLTDSYATPFYLAMAIPVGLLLVLLARHLLVLRALSKGRR